MNFLMSVKMLVARHMYGKSVKECLQSVSIQNGGSDVDAAMFFGGIDLYSDHWVTSCILALAGLPGTIFRLASQNRLW